MRYPNLLLSCALSAPLLLQSAKLTAAPGAEPWCAGIGKPLSSAPPVDCRGLLLQSAKLTAAQSTKPAAAPSIEPWCAAIGKRLGSVPPTDCRNMGLEPAPMVSARGHALMLRDIPPKAQQLAQTGKSSHRATRILVIGGIHGDELTSASIVFRWLRWLNEGESQQYHWRVIPVANPDGLLANPPQRTNGRGVDLNRNFPTPDWSVDAHAYWAKRTNKDPRRFPGQSAMSEPETVWLRDEIEHFQPDVVVSVHAPFGILDYDGPFHQPRRFGNLRLNRLGIYPGSLGNFGGVFKNTPVITIELPNATAMPSVREQREIWDDMLTWVRRNIATRKIS